MPGDILHGLRVVLKGESQNFKSSMQQNKEDVKAFRNELKNMVGTLGIGALGIGTATKFLLDSSKAAEEAARIQGQLGAVIRSTGGAAGMSASDINNLASEISELTGVEDDSIVRAEALLLTFTKVGHQVFPDATQAAVDMSAALGQDLQSSITMIGKALQEPIQGVTALRRVGVALTDQQEAQIKKFMEVNDVVGAQKIILQELQTEFGGTAQAMTEAGLGVDKLTNAWGNLKEQVGEGINLLGGPVVQKLADWVSATVKANRIYTDLTDAMEKGAITYTEAVGISMGLRTHLLSQGEAQDWLRKKVLQYDMAQSKVNISGGEAIQMHEELTEAVEEEIEVTEEMKKAAEEAAKALQDQLNFQLKELDDLIGGELGPELEDYTRKQAELSEEMATTKKRIDELQAKPWLKDSDKEELEELKGKYGELGEQYTTNADKHDEANKRIMFNLLEQRAMIGGLSTEEFLFLNEIAKKWGLVDEATATFVENADGYFELLGTGAIKAKDLIGLIGDTIGSIPKDNYINFWVTTYGEVPIPSTYTPKTSNKTAVPEQHGGTVMAGGAYWVGEAGPEPFIPDQNGYILNNADAMKAMAGSGVIINGDIIINPSPGQNGRQVYQEFRSELEKDVKRKRAAGMEYIKT